MFRLVNSRTSRKRGFTLVEILVVITVVALLSALLLSAFSSVRARSHTASCASNLKQLGVALQLYTADNRGFFPPGLVSPIGNLGCGWAEGIYPYLKSTKVFQCPSYPNGEYRLGCPPSDESDGIGYLERRDWDGSYDLINLRSRGRFNEVRLRRPSSTVVLMDGTGTWPFYDIRIGNSAGQTMPEEELLDFSRLGDRHNGGANLCFADGHVKWLSFEQMRDKNLWRPD